MFLVLGIPVVPLRISGERFDLSLCDGIQAIYRRCAKIHRRVGGGPALGMCGEGQVGGCCLISYFETLSLPLS
jgi:hypothetical protein